MMGAYRWRLIAVQGKPCMWQMTISYAGIYELAR